MTPDRHARARFQSALALLLAFGLMGLSASAALAQGRGDLLGLGLFPSEPGPPQSRFVLPHTHPDSASESAATDRISTNLFGMPGLIDMPSAGAFPDAEFQVTLGSFAGISRLTLSFQISPRLTGAFRYNEFRDLNFSGFEDYYDRAFDLHYQILRERGWRPAVAVGLRDFAGTGIQAAEYIVASKRFALPAPGSRSGSRGGSGNGQLTVTGGLGWGRLGTYGDIGSPFGADRPSFDINSTGGELATDQWFRGPAAPFGGIEWQPGGRWDRWRVKLEYASDAYDLEAGQQGLFERDSPLNLGVEYQVGDVGRVGLYSMYGSEIGVLVNLAFNPRRGQAPLRGPAPGLVAPRPDRAAFPELWTSTWRATPGAEATIAGRLAELLAEDGVIVTGLALPEGPRGADTAVLRVENDDFFTTAPAIGRTARAMALILPPSVEIFRIVLEDGGLAISETTLRRSDLEALDGTADRAEALAAVTTVAPAAPTVTGIEGVNAPDRYPRRSLRVRPYVASSLFDPSNPVRLDFGVSLTGRYEPVRGLVFDGQLRQLIEGNIGDAELSESALPRVRTDAPLYAEVDEITLRRLTASYVAKLPGDLYGRATAGYLEKMYGGVSGELLWKPVARRLGLGLELNYVGQRDFDQRFGFREYEVFTGHASAYYEFGGGYLGQLDVGRYLAEDLGATITFTRAFRNGWQVGAFATFTDVSAEEFGEGSFDKGITFRIPVQALTGLANTATLSRTIRPIQRDGGARLSVSGRLYNRVRAGHGEAVFADWSRVWR